MMAAESHTYLIIAKYNYAKWKALVQRGGKDVDYAERAAEKLFPEYKIPLFTFSKDNPPQTFRDGLQFVGTFFSNIFARLPLLPEELTPQEKVDILDPIIEEGGLPDPPAGWLAVVDQSEAGAFIQDMSAYGGYLWDMYDIQIGMIADDWSNDALVNTLDTIEWSKEALNIKFGELNDDKTTNDVYLRMSIRNWS